jgi:hypothetical protein
MQKMVLNTFSKMCISIKFLGNLLHFVDHKLIFLMTVKTKAKHPTEMLKGNRVVCVYVHFPVSYSVVDQ